MLVVLCFVNDRTAKTCDPGLHRNSKEKLKDVTSHEYCWFGGSMSFNGSAGLWLLYLDKDRNNWKQPPSKTKWQACAKTLWFLPNCPFVRIPLFSYQIPSRIRGMSNFSFWSSFQSMPDLTHPIHVHQMLLPLFIFSLIPKFSAYSDNWLSISPSSNYWAHFILSTSVFQIA